MEPCKHIPGSLKKKKKNPSGVCSCPSAEAGEPLSWCVGGKKAAERKLAATETISLLECIIIIIYVASSVQAILSNLRTEWEFNYIQL